MNKLKTVDSKVLSILKECPETRFDDMKLELNILLNLDKNENEIVGGEPDEGEAQPEKRERDYER